jgi:hypothetical protein
MQWLDGHPLSMRLVLPYLESTDPEALLAGLQGTAPLPGRDDGPDGRLTSLPASLGYSFARLDAACQQLLAAICLFHGIAAADVLGAFSAVDGVPQRFQRVSMETWDEVMNAGAGGGLLTGLGGGMYRIHPALPAYLAARWRKEEGAVADVIATARNQGSGRIEVTANQHARLLREGRLRLDCDVPTRFAPGLRMHLDVVP